MMDQTDLYCQVTREKFSSQESLNREFGTKASSMLAFGAALLGAGAITLNFSDSKLTLSDPPVQAFIALIGTFLWTAASSLFVLLTWRWGNGPTVSSLAKALNHHQDREYAKLVGDEYMKSVNAN